MKATTAATSALLCVVGLLSLTLTVGCTSSQAEPKEPSKFTGCNDFLRANERYEAYANYANYGEQPSQDQLQSTALLQLAGEMDLLVKHSDYQIRATSKIIRDGAKDFVAIVSGTSTNQNPRNTASTAIGFVWANQHLGLRYCAERPGAQHPSGCRELLAAYDVYDSAINSGSSFDVDVYNPALRLLAEDVGAIPATNPELQVKTSAVVSTAKGYLGLSEGTDKNPEHTLDLASSQLAEALRQGLAYCAR